MTSGYSAKGYVEDSPCGPDTVARRFTLEFELGAGEGIFKDYRWKDSFVLAISKDSSGVYSIGKDVEKFCGIPLADVKKDIAAGKETPDVAIIYGLCNIMNGGKDVYFWTNGTRLGGSAKKNGPLMTVIEQISHEAGVHLTRLLMTRAIAAKIGVPITNDEWVKHDYGAGEYSFPAMGDPNDETPKIVAITEESFATMGSVVISAITDEFIQMAKPYL